MSKPNLPLLVKQGILSRYNPVVNLYNSRLRKVSHQHHFSGRTQEKWRLIEAELAGPPGSLLDIGCSEDVFTLRGPHSAGASGALRTRARP